MWKLSDWMLVRLLKSDATYSEKFKLLNQQMRWEVADHLRSANLQKVNKLHKPVRANRNFYTTRGKRILDIAISASALVIFSPIIAAVSLVTYFDLGRPVFFSQDRIGLSGEKFVITKIRTMRDELDENGKPLLGELRVTRVGRLIRKASLDELLNFWSILKGDMSVIGPRPLVPEYLDRFSFRHRQRLEVKPGLECPTLRASEQALTYEDQFENDCWYVENCSFDTDLKLLWRIVETAFDRRQNQSRSESSRGSFMGYDELGGVITTKNIPSWALDLVLSRHGMLHAEPHTRGNHGSK